jgi:hypothetical protein
VSAPPSVIAHRNVRLAGVIASAGVLMLTVVIVGSITPGYRPLADAVSRLGSHDEPHALFVRLGFALYGALIIAGAGPLGRITPDRGRLVAILVATYGAAAIVAGSAPKDPPRSAHTLVSRIHVDATLVGGAALLAAMALAARYAPDQTDRRVATLLGGLTAIGVAVFPFLWGSRIYGLVEIALLAAASGWLAGVAARLLGAPAFSDGSG